MFQGKKQERAIRRYIENRKNKNESIIESAKISEPCRKRSDMEENTNGSIQKVMEYDGSMDTFSFFVGPYRNLNEIPEETQGMTQYGLNIEEALEAYYSMEEKDSYHTRENIIGIDYITGMSRPGQMQGMNVHQYLVRNRTMNRAAFMWIRDSAPALYDYLSKNFIPAIFNYSLDSQEEEVRIKSKTGMANPKLMADIVEGETPINQIALSIRDNMDPSIISDLAVLYDGADDDVRDRIFCLLKSVNCLDEAVLIRTGNGAFLVCDPTAGMVEKIQQKMAALVEKLQQISMNLREQDVYTKNDEKIHAELETMAVDVGTIQQSIQYMLLRNEQKQQEAQRREQLEKKRGRPKTERANFL